MSRRALLAVLLGGLTAVALSWAFNAWLKSDSCLDFGGRWDANKGVCDMPVDASSAPLYRTALRSITPDGRA